jgi:hypothetical protein
MSRNVQRSAIASSRLILVQGFSAIRLQLLAFQGLIWRRIVAGAAVDAMLSARSHYERQTGEADVAETPRVATDLNSDRARYPAAEMR